jgi:hypothetical protein
VSYNAARCERIVGSEESSFKIELEITKNDREAISDLLDNLSALSRNQQGFGFDEPEQ